MKTAEGVHDLMLAIVNYAPYDYRLEHIPVPAIDESEILVRVRACGICAGDIKSYHGSQMIWGGGIFPAWQKVPVVPGHEFIGEVVAIGDKAAENYRLDIGDMAIAEQIVPCGKCRFCLSGERWMCEKGDIHGHIRNEAEGGMAEYMKYTVRDVVYRVPQSIKAAHAAMIEPLSCAVHTIERADIHFGDVVVIAGLGPIGLCKLQLAKLKNPALLIGIDLKKNRLDAAIELGADLVFNPRQDDVVEEVKRLTGGYGCDVYIHSSGSPKGVIQGLQMLRKLGTFVEFSVFMEDTSVDWSIIGDRKELLVKGAHISGNDGYRIAINMLEKGLINVDPIVTHQFPLSEYKKAFENAESGQSIKTVLIP